MGLFEGLRLHEQIPERNSAEMKKFRKIVSEIFVPLVCIYCQEQLEEFELDHFIPWSKLPINRFWNLFPSCQTCNLKKTNHIIDMEPLIVGRLKNFLGIWVEYIGEEQSKALELGGGNMRYLLKKDQTSKIDILIDQLFQISENLV